jgi:penicillin-binding protein 1A
VSDVPGPPPSGRVPRGRTERTARSARDWRDSEPDLPQVRHEWRRRRRAHRHRRGRRLLGALVIAFAIIAGLGAGALAIFVRSPDLLVGCHLQSTRPVFFGQDSFVYAADGVRLGAVPTTRNRQPVALAQMSRWLPLATVAIEDRRFWHHGAIDYAGVLRAAIADLRAGHIVQGGSTLTQQLVRDRYLGPGRVTLSRKLKEACLAVQLAQRWPKRQILQAYLNLVFYGHEAYGAEAAARTYFSVPARDLTLKQAALLAGLPQAPSIYDPMRHPGRALRRRNEVLAAMRRAGQISAARYRIDVASPLRLRPGHLYSSVRAPTFFDAVQRELVRRYGRSRVRHGGLRVDTTLDWRLQRLAVQAIGAHLHLRSDPAAALVAIDPASGAIRAMTAVAPGRGRLRFNLALQSRREAGSAFKVFTLTTAVEQGIPLRSVWQGPASITIPDRRCLNANGPWVVHNYADETAGTTTLLGAIARSVNTIFAQVVVRVGPRRVVEMAHRMGIRSPLKPVCAITLGPEGVSPLDMADAFATLASGGIRHDAQSLQRVVSARGRVLAQLRPGGRRVLAPWVARRVTYALTGVILAGTGTAANPGRPAAGKTGTAESFKDAWFCGFVPQLTTCVWVGYPQAELPLLNIDGFPQVFGGSVPALIWHDFMVPALRGVPVRPLPTVTPSDLGAAPVAPAPAPAVPAPSLPLPLPPAPAPVLPSPVPAPHK